MAVDTFSLAVTGARADFSQTALAVEPVKIPDSFARAGDLLNAASTGAFMLCQNADGSFSNYVLDAERSTPDRPVLKPV